MNPDEDLEISGRTWNKVGSSILKDGYREGASDGHDRFFQNGFDLGYVKGFENAEKIGIINGALRVLNQLKMKRNDDPLPLNSGEFFENAHRGFCIMCPQAKQIKFYKENIVEAARKFETCSIEELLEKQKIHLESCLKISFDENQQLLDEIGIHDIS